MKNFDFWWRLIRPHTLTASLVPVLVGTAYAYVSTDSLHFGLFAAMLAATCLIQIATNLFNEYYDYIRGLDTKDSVGIGGTIVHDGASPQFVLNLALGAYGAALLLGLYICALSSWWLAVIGAGFMLIGYLYTGGPYPISASPFGELFAGLSLGSGVICIANFIQTGQLSWAVFWVSVPIAILIGLILTSNNIRDRQGDQENGRHTLAILLGHQKAVHFMAVMFGLTYVWVMGLIVWQDASLCLLLSLVSLPAALKTIKLFTPPNQAPKQMMPAMKLTAQTNTLFGLAYALGLVLGKFIG